MIEYLKSLGYSVSAGILAGAIAYSLSFLIFLVRFSNKRTFLKRGKLRELFSNLVDSINSLNLLKSIVNLFSLIISLLTDFLLEFLKYTPVLIIAIILGNIFILGNLDNPRSYYVIWSLIGAFILTPLMWKEWNEYVLDELETQIYPTQLLILGVPTIKVSVEYIYPKILKRTFVTLLSLFLYSFIIDTTIGFIDGAFNVGAINWFVKSYGYKLGEQISGITYLDIHGLTSIFIKIAPFLIVVLAVSYLIFSMKRKIRHNPEAVELRGASSEAVIEILGLDITGPYGYKLLYNPDLKFPPSKSKSITIKPGDVVWLNGPSGSGKSLLAKMIAFKEIPHLFNIYSADIKVRGRAIIVPQEPALYLFPYVSVRKYFEMFLGEDDSVNCLPRLQGQNFENVMVKDISAGQRRIVAISLSICLAQKFAQGIEPVILILDEPDVALDDERLEYLLNKIVDFRKKYPDSVVLLISHNRWTFDELIGKLKMQGIEFESRYLRITKQLQHKYYLEYLESMSYEEGEQRLQETEVVGNEKDILRIRFNEGKQPTVIFPSNESLPINISVSSGTRDARFKTYQFIKVSGPNGSGKSSFVRALAGVNDYKNLHLEIKDADDWMEIKKIIDTLHPDRLIYLYDDIENALPRHKSIETIIKDIIGKDNIEGFKKKIEERTGLEISGQKTIDEFSGGERQKIVLGLLEKWDEGKGSLPQILILDETFNRLDPDNLNALITTLKSKYATQLVIYISHNKEVARSLRKDGEIKITKNLKQ